MKGVTVCPASSQVLHEYWMVLRNHVSAIDELGMATERLRVRLPDEPKPKLLHIIEPHEASHTSHRCMLCNVFVCLVVPTCWAKTQHLGVLNAFGAASILRHIQHGGPKNEYLFHCVFWTQCFLIDTEKQN